MKLVAVVVRAACAACAFLVGWIIYMVAMMMTTCDGALSLIFQPFVGALFSGLFTGMSVVLGLALYARPLRRWWHETLIPASLVLVSSAFLLVFGYWLGFREQVVHPESGRGFETLHSGVAISC